MPSILTSLKLTESQRTAATLRDVPVVVTAGAGSGKTRALVGRYLSLLEDGLPLRSIIAVTFTDKAARAMRTRIRQQIGEWLAMDAPGKEQWQVALADLDAARIGTIHSLCAELLRTHPVEAGLDPRFEVLEEGIAATFKSQAIEAALAWASTDAGAARLFSLLNENSLRETLVTLLDRRLDADALLSRDVRVAWTRELSAAIAAFADDTCVRGAIETLRDSSIVRAGGDKLAANVAALTGNWSAFESARASSDWDAALSALFAMRRQGMSGSVGKAGPAKDAVKLLRDAYDEILSPWLGGAKNTDSPPRWSLDVQIGDALPDLRRLSDQAQAEYRRLKGDRQALDFDDLEAGAVQLLTRHDAVRKRWLAETRSVLVDEFQDTNERQRQIVYALSGFRSTPDIERSTLFVVGDGKQSIYRFRGADVTVFRQVQDDAKQSGGRPLEFNLTFRAHEPLVEATNKLLEPILGADDPKRPYAVAFAPLRAQRKAPREGIRQPFVEFCLGLAEHADAGRAIAASALAARLIRLRNEERAEWGDMALLFRASTAFGVYEDAFERAGVPFITVAGRGFYDRPEIRDLLNVLVAISDPFDDLAITGLLRSPAIGLSDATIYLLRWDGDKPRSLWKVLTNFKYQISNVKEDEGKLVERAREIVEDLHRWAGRATVGEVLKRFLDMTNYLAMLRQVEGGARLQRNIEKLLADAHKSQLVSASDFLEYVQALRDVGARESEAPVEVGGAVQLMTVHKAKGLEFPIVVIADAAHERRGSAGPVLLDSDLGTLLAIQNQDGAQPVARRLAALREQDREDAEDRRLLYVAATRAKEKLIVNGHVGLKRDGKLSLRGWLGRLGEVAGLAETTFDSELTAPQTLELQFGASCTLYPAVLNVAAEKETRKVESREANDVTDQVAPLKSQEAEHADAKIRTRGIEPPLRVWRVVPRAQRPTGPAWVVGKLVHEAIHRWRFPDAPDFEAFLYPHALEAGLTDPAEIAGAMHEARRLLARFRANPLWAEMNAASRWHELPYIATDDSGIADAGIIDVLYRNGDEWTIADFKTDELRADQVADRIAEEKYDEQLRRYAAAVAAQLDVHPRTILVFLNVARQMVVVTSTHAA
jgi:ATP-dependent helicase/nuclease subunit A